MLIIEKLEEKNIEDIVGIYNSNKTFLENHMGITSVTREFIINEIKEMENIGFSSLIIKNSKGNTIGVCDYKIEEEVYLSLLMIDAKLKRKGFGKTIYNQIEGIFKSKNSKRIRIDVVHEYEENVLGFWEKQGFVCDEKIQLEWSGHKSNAIRMYKSI